MPISSLPSKYGIGTLGKGARDFIDFLEKSGQTYWQVLPIGPTGYGDSPYQSFSSNAGNPYFIDLDDLCDEGYLEKEEYVRYRRKLCGLCTDLQYTFYCTEKGRGKTFRSSDRRLFIFLA